ncbi:MAG: FAD-dependent monooxygenase [Gammaproteobacteria bacterium]|nr:FAD-dependent monooxygenase [Gammaproteobacteria bacterium]
MSNESNEKLSLIETDVLIVGTGPAGASASALLATYGIDNIVINKFAWTCRTPRAHITNQRTIEALRDLGVEQDCLDLATPQELMGENTFAESLAGEEIARVLAWGMPPARKADYELSSPAKMFDLPQNLLEPILTRTAAHRGSKVRFNTEYLSFEQDDEGVTTTLLDLISQEKFQVRSKYLIGADGGNSKIAEDADLPMEGEMGMAGSMNIVFDADLSKYVEHRPSLLYWLIQPGGELAGLGIPLIRMVRPWNKWLCIWGYDISQGTPKVTDEYAKEILHQLIGDDQVPIKIDSTSTWTVNSMYAVRNTKDRIFCMGDAVHRHTPMNGLGSNTSIQDAFNLSWKLAMVIKGEANPSLLESYNDERIPVGEQVVKRATKSLGDLGPIMEALGLANADSPEQKIKNIAKRKETNLKAEEQRKKLRQAVEGTQYIYNCHGVEMNLRYTSSAVISDGSPDEVFIRDKELYHQASSRPGAMVPHVWLIDQDQQKISTVDICGKGKFTLITGLGGLEQWSSALAEIEKTLGINVNLRVIGPGQDYEDIYGDFARVRDISETGALLVRPDNIVAWRAQEANEKSGAELVASMQSILGKTD